jgi:hypothetical protein
MISNEHPDKYYVDEVTEQQLMEDETLLIEFDI